MAYAPYSSNKIQFGDEVSPGTNVATTMIWPGPMADIEDVSTYEMVNQHIGLVAPTLDSIKPSQFARLTIPETELSAEILPYILGASVDEVTPTGVGPYVWTYVFPKTTNPGTTTYTIEAGNALAIESVHQMSYAYCRTFTISGNVNEAWKVSSVWEGQKKDLSYVTGTSGTRGFTASAAVPTGHQRLMANKSVLYIDDTGGSFGGTAVTGVLQSFSADFDMGMRPVFTMDGNAIYFSAIERVSIPRATFSIKFKLEDSSVAEDERLEHQNQVIRLFQIEANGSDATRKVIMSLPAKYTAFSTYEDADGSTNVVASGVIGYSTTEATFGTITVTNNLATLP